MLRIRDFAAELHDWMIVMHPTRAMTYPTIAGAVWNDKTDRATVAWPRPTCLRSPHGWRRP
jgi:hypothetical protein